MQKYNINNLKDLKNLNDLKVEMEVQLNPGDKVKIDIEKYRWQKDSLTEVFWKFMEDNKDRIFTLVEHRKNSDNVLWEIKEDPRWLLYNDYLNKVNK